MCTEKNKAEQSRAQDNVECLSRMEATLVDPSTEDAGVVVHAYIPVLRQ